MKKHEELVIITKTYDLILWSCNHTGRFPRQQRFVLGERIERPVPQSIQLHSHRLTRSQPASGLRRQPELCQQAAVSVDQDGFAVVACVGMVSS